MIFDLEKNQPIIRVESLTIPELNSIWINSETSDIAHMKLCYIYHIADPRSPYAKLGEEDRHKTVKKDFAKTFKIDKELLHAIEKYKELNTSVITRSFDSIKNALEAINKFLDESSKNLTDANIDKIMKAVEKMELFTKAYNSAKKASELDVEEISQYKKNVKPSDILTGEDDDDDY